ncbi:GAF domain-containing protein [Lentzea atacamensis]|uniref:GAF domain-containing protein n=1 Tax=Lentzea atacamensis TaxID=531938 RepID=A0A316IC64_9PSEU|nr:GAF and ANTAR domain-containing protein [Lentzea atacamensis]PWK84910.1 GAF domain-containing protein [Lentzea atacamensis]
MGTGQRYRVPDVVADEYENQRTAVRHACIACGIRTNAVGTAIYLWTGGGAVRTFETTGFCGEEIAELQTVFGEGPASAATRQNWPVLVPDLADSASAARWPHFAPAAVAAGVAATFAFPLTLGALSLGVLEIHRDADGALTPDEIADVVQLADAVMTLLLDRSARVVGWSDVVEHGVLFTNSDKEVVAQVSDQRVAQTFVELADTLVERFDSTEFLHVLAERCVELLVVDAAGILLADEGGSLKLMASSSDLLRPLEHFLLQSEEAPSTECFNSGRSVRCHDLRAEPQRWPRFSVAAVQLGFTAVDVVPMRLRDEVIGTLNLFRTTPGALPPATAALAQSFANVATLSLLQVRAIRHNELLAEQLQSALTSRTAIEQAKGVLTERLQIDVADAFSLMRNYARNTNQLLSDVAGQVNARSPEIAGLTRINQPRSRW